MQNSLQYTLGIDLGISSIGTALIDENKNKIIDFGVRIFEIAEGAATRREARQARKTIKRRKQRLQNLKKTLINHNLYPIEREIELKLLACSPYRLRAEASKQEITLYELGRCLIHIAKFRGAGFLTEASELAENTDQVGNSDTETNKKTTKKKSKNLYQNLEKMIADDKITLSEFFLKRLPKKGKDIEENKPVRRRERFIETNLIDYAVPRFLVKEDFHKIWDCQQKFHSELTQELKNEVETLIFQDKPHAPYATGYCSALGEKGGLRLPKMAKLAEKRRIYEEINNLRFSTNLNTYHLSREMRDCLVEILMTGTKLTEVGIKKALKPFCSEVITKVNTEKKEIKGYAPTFAFKHMAVWENMSEAKQEEILQFIADPIIPNDPKGRLYCEEDMLKKLLQMFELEGKEEERNISKALSLLPSDRSKLGKIATEKVLEKLIEGRIINNIWQPTSHTEALIDCQIEREIEKNTYDFLPYYGEILKYDTLPIHAWHKDKADRQEAEYGRVPNPVVHTVMNQLRKIVNEIINLYGKPNCIRIELAREMGKSAKKRKEIQDTQAKNAKRNAEISEILHKHGLKANATNILKYKIWEEQKSKDIYSNQEIGIKEFEKCEIDHIIPKSRGGTNTYSNLALTSSSNNLGKLDNYAYDFMQQKFPNQYQHVMNEIVHAPHYPPSKAWRFTEEAKERFKQFGDNDETDRRLTDTSYMAKLACKYLWAICEDVQPVKGQITAQLRHLWGLDGLEYDLIENYDKNNLINKETGEYYWRAKPRIDQRHHALDAFVIANTSISMMQRLTKAHKVNKKLVQEDVGLPMCQNTAELRTLLIEKLKQVKVSIKPDHGLEGQLHNKTKYRILLAHPKEKDKYITVYKKKFDSIDSQIKVEQLYSNAMKQFKNLPEVKIYYDKVSHIISSIEAKLVEADLQLQNELITNTQKAIKTKAITEKAIVQRAILLARKAKIISDYYPSVEVMRMAYQHKYLKYGYEPRNNLRADFFVNKNGEVDMEIITRFNANNKILPQWEQEKGKLLWQLYINDIFEMNIDEELKIKLKLPFAGKILFRVQKMSGNQLSFYMLSDAKAEKAKNNSDNQDRWFTTRTIDILIEGQARKVELSPFGKVIKKHKKLWYGKKKI